jgi:hypothetical protein
MYLTEIYAKRKWCHRTFPNTGQCSETPFKCEASECMAWRWGDPVIPNTPNPNRRGFCGLAGQPEVV